MKPRSIKVRNGADNKSKKGFIIHAKAIKLTEYNGRPGFIAEQISGGPGNIGRNFIVVQKENPSKDYKGVGFDKDGLMALKIGVRSNVCLSDASYLVKASADDPNKLPVIEARRATRMAGAYQPESSLMITSFGGDVNNLTGNILFVRKGIHAKHSDLENLDRQKKIEKVNNMIEYACSNLDSGEGLAIVFNGVNEDTNESLTVQKVFSRFHRESDKEQYTELSVQDFIGKTKNALVAVNADGVGSCVFYDFKGTQSSGVGFLDGILESNVDICVVPAKKIPLTGGSLLEKSESRAVIAGIGGLGFSIDPPKAEGRGFPVVQQASMEACGLTIGRKRVEDPAADKCFRYVGDKVIGQSDLLAFTKLINQISILNGLPLVSVSYASKTAIINESDKSSNGQDKESQPVSVEKKNIAEKKEIDAHTSPSPSVAAMDQDMSSEKDGASASDHDAMLGSNSIPGIPEGFDSDAFNFGDLEEESGLAMGQ